MKVINTYDHHDRFVVGSPDYPFSYMMGLAGDIAFNIDCIQPQHSFFFGFEV